MSEFDKKRMIYCGRRLNDNNKIIYEFYKEKKEDREQIIFFDTNDEFFGRVHYVGKFPKHILSVGSFYTVEISEEGENLIYPSTLKRTEGRTTEDLVKKWTLLDEIAGSIKNQKATTNKINKDNKYKMGEMTLNEIYALSLKMNGGQKEILIAKLIRWVNT
tara:strand:- start:465 stop:947 length:483 start_codon:yes stop_codon:yes gene_type:complete